MNQSIPSILVWAAAIVTLATSQLGIAGEEIDIQKLSSEVKTTEEAFAQTMVERDFQAFVSFLADEAVFFGGTGEIRGKESVAAAWKPFFSGTAAPFSWRPESATVIDSGSLGFTSGPVFAPDGKRIGTLNSVWRRGANNAWKIVFDRGCPNCECPPTDN